MINLANILDSCCGSKVYRVLWLSQSLDGRALKIIRAAYSRFGCFGPKSLVSFFERDGQALCRAWIAIADGG